MQYTRMRDPAQLVRMGDSVRIEWHRFLKGILVTAPMFGASNNGQRSRFKIKAISREGAATLKQKDDSGKTMTIQQYFKSQGVNLQHPNLPCVLLTKRAWYPLELRVSISSSPASIDKREQVQSRSRQQEGRPQAQVGRILLSSFA
jgi:hypothetical protein